MNSKMLKPLLLILVASMLSSCGFKEGKSRGNYMQVCVSHGFTEKVCKCSWDGAKDHFGADRLIAEEESGIPSAEFTSAQAQITANCIAGISNSQVSALLETKTPPTDQPTTPSAGQPMQQVPAQLAQPDTSAQSTDPNASAQATNNISVAGDSVSKTIALGNHNLRITRSSDTEPFVVSVDEKEVRRVEAFSLDSSWSSGGGARPGYALLRINSGGTACPMEYFIVEVSPEGVTRASPHFGSCSDQITSAETIPGGVVISMPDFQGPSESDAARENAASRTKTYVWKDGALKVSP